MKYIYFWCDNIWEFSNTINGQFTVKKNSLVRYSHNILLDLLKVKHIYYFSYASAQKLHYAYKFQAGGNTIWQELQGVVGRDRASRL